jgi:hypothetical protein
LSISLSLSNNIPQDLRLIIFSKVSLLILFRSLLIIRAPKENSLSEGAEVAGIYKYFLANKTSTGNLSLLVFYQAKGLIYNMLVYIKVYNKVIISNKY